MKLTLVCGPWGSGTTAVTQLLEAMGGWVPGPHFSTFDPRTPNSFESKPFKEVLDRFVDREAIRLSHDGVGNELTALRHELEAQPGQGPLVMKAPLAAGALPEICGVFETRVIFVVRPFDALHATRMRRGWGDGSVESAELIYERMTSFIASKLAPYTIVYYDELRGEPAAVARRLAHFSGLTYSADALDVVRTGAAEPLPSGDQ